MLDLDKGSYNDSKEVAMNKEEWRNVSLKNQSTD